MGKMSAIGGLIPKTTVTIYNSMSGGLVIGSRDIGNAAVQYTLSAANQEVAQEVEPTKPFEIDLTPNLDNQIIIPGSVCFTWGTDTYFDRLGKIYRNISATTGLGTLVGSLDYTTGKVTLDTYDEGDNTIEVHSLLTRFGKQFFTSGVFRTPGAPIRPGSLSIQATMSDGTLLSATAEFDGNISAGPLLGYVDVETGVVYLACGEYVLVAGNETKPWFDLAAVVDDQVWKPAFIFAETLSYTCVVYSYIPLDADLIGIDPVRLPVDGRVPIVKKGNVVVVHNTQTQQLSTGLTAGQEITLNREDISVVRLYDANGLYVPTVHYSFDKVTQILTMADPLDLSSFTEPLVANHRREDMALVSEVQINGQLTLARGLKHDYPVEGTFVSSALLFGDLQARVYGLFDQKTWTSSWSDDQIGDASTANFNDIDYPITCTNKGAVKERWAIKHTDSSGHIEVIGEKYGVVYDGYITQDIQPINPATGEPFFHIPFEGWGAGWSTSNVLRFNTDAADGHVWVARTTLQGEETEPEDEFTLQIRGDNE